MGVTMQVLFAGLYSMTRRWSHCSMRMISGWPGNIGLDSVRLRAPFRYTVSSVLKFIMVRLVLIL